jgi:hypothetical protein
MPEETRHRYGRVESRHVSEWAPLNTDVFMCSLPDDESAAAVSPTQKEPG